MHPENVSCGAFGQVRPQRTQIRRACFEAAPCLHHPTPLRRIECRWNLLPPEQPRVVIPYSQWRRRYDNDTRVSAFRSTMASRIELGQAFGFKKGVNVFLKPVSPIEPSRDINQTSKTGKPEAPATGTDQFSCSERRLFHHRSIGGERNVKKRGRKNCRLHLSSRNSSIPLLPDDQLVTASPPSPVKEEGDVILNDADISDSIARALFDALQENRNRNQLPAMRISGGSRRRLLTTEVIWRRGGNHQL